MRTTALSTCILAALAAAPAAFGADRIELAVAKSGSANISQLSGLSSKELQLEHVIEIGGSRLGRFQQYHLGVPVLGEAIVVETRESVFTDAVKQANGAVLLGLEDDLASVQPRLDYNIALDMARKAAGAPSTDSDRMHLYVARDSAGGKARLVYLAAFDTQRNGQPSRPALMLDADTGAVLQQWESLDTGDGFGPGSHLKAVAASLNASGFDDKQIAQLFEHAQALYWRENTAMADTACGADLAAVDLGLDVQAVRGAFIEAAGTCRSNVRKEMVDVSGFAQAIGEELDEALPGPYAAPKAALPTTYDAWRRLVRADFSQLGPYKDKQYNLNRFKSAIGAGSANVRTTTMYMNREIIDEHNGFSTSSLDYCSRNGACVDIRTRNTGTRNQSSAFNAWRHITRYQQRVIPNNTNGLLTVDQNWTMWTSAEATAVAWSFTKSADVTIGATFKFSDFFGAKFDIKFGVSEQNSKTLTNTVTSNFGHPKVKVPKGCSLVVQMQERWKPTTDTHVLKPEITGTVRGRTYPNFNGNEYHNVSAATYFNQLPSAASYTATINQRYGREIQANYWGRSNTTGAIGGACALQPG